MLIKDTAICIRVSDYSETSQILTFFTRQHGKISAIAKGTKRAKSSFDGPIELFANGQIVYSEPRSEKLATLTEFEQKRGFSGFSKNLFSYHCALFAVELVSSMTTDKDPHPQLFESLIDFLEHLETLVGTDKMKRKQLAFLILFQLHLLSEVGLQPIITECVSCKNAFSEGWNQVHFSNEGKGLVCRDCEGAYADKITVTKSCAKTLSDIKSLPDSNEKILLEIEGILISYFRDILGRQPRLARYIID
jgi:DNA repair protein RecO (recombination protein O)